MKIVFRTALIVLLVVLCASCGRKAAEYTTQPEGLDGGSPGKLTCVTMTDFYIAHLTAYQDNPAAAPGERFKPLCQDLPATGKTFLTVDMIDRDVRQTPIAVKLVEEEVSDPDQANAAPPVLRTLLDIAPKLYKQGVVEAQADFNRPGHYALLVMVGDQAAAEDIIRIPLRVALGTGISMEKIIIYILPVMFVAFLFVSYRYYKQSKTSIGKLTS